MTWRRSSVLSVRCFLLTLLFNAVVVGELPLLLHAGTFTDLNCQVVAGGNELTWEFTGTFDESLVERDNALIATLPGTDTDFLDMTPPVGQTIYRITGCDPVCGGTAWSCSLPDAAGTFRVESVTTLPGGSLLVPVLLDNLYDVVAFSYGLTHDGSVLDITDVDPGETVLMIIGVPAFFAPQLNPGGESGYTVGVALDFPPNFNDFLPVGVDQEIVVGTYSVSPTPATSDLTFTDDLGVPPVGRSIVVIEATYMGETLNMEVDSLDGTVDVVGNGFQRGDCDGNTMVQVLIDALFLLNAAFVPGAPQPPCNDACDVNDNGIVNALVDGLFLLSYGFLGGMEPPPPFGTCAADLTDDAVECAADICP